MVPAGNDLSRAEHSPPAARSVPMNALSLCNLIGRAPPFQECQRVIEKVAGCDATVLIQGETGTGKELGARAIHYLSTRRDQPFVPVNCGAIPDSLVENEVFGHVRGAYTDARDHQAGLIALAEHGTLFLDEIETLSPRGQVILLRFLEDRQYRPLGGRHYLRSDVRIVAASNADLAEMVREGAFRRDLLYRLAIVSFTMPPLREREGDVVLLARYFLERFATQYHRTPRRLHGDAVAMLEHHDWPGNVRELENLMHREVVMGDDADDVRSVILPGGRPAMRRGMPLVTAESLCLGLRRAKEHVVAEFEKAFIARALGESGGNVSHAARIAGKERRAFGKLLKKHHICTGDFRTLDAD